MSMFQTGFSAIANTADRAKKSGSGPFLRYVLWEPEETKVIRFLTDDIITANFYEFVQNSSGGISDFIVLPGREKLFHSFINPETGVGMVKGMGDQRGQLVPPKPRVRTVAPVVIQTEESDGVHDSLREFSVNGSDYTGRDFGIVKQSEKLFWKSLSLYNARYGTICDRPYEIKRVGKGIDTDYSIIPLDKDADWTDNAAGVAALQEKYGYGRQRDRDDPERYMSIPMTLLEWAERHASEERMRELLGGGHYDAPQAIPADEAQATPASQSPSSDDTFNDLRSRLNRHKAAGG